MTDYNFMKQLEMWKATNYGAQMQQLKAAGLNPGLIYGMGGAGGATTGQAAGNVTGGHAPVGGGEAVAMAGMGINAGLMRAQKENIEANTEKTKAETAKASGPETEKIRTETAGIALSNEFLKQTLNDRVDIINTDMNRQIEELDLAIGRKEEERGTRAMRIEGIRAQATGEILKNVLIDAQTKSTGQSIEESKARVVQMQAQIDKWAEEISQGWVNLERQEFEVLLKKWEAEVKASFPGIGQALGRLMNGAMEQLSRATGQGSLPKYKAPERNKQ